MKRSVEVGVSSVVLLAGSAVLAWIVWSGLSDRTWQLPWWGIILLMVVWFAFMRLGIRWHRGPKPGGYGAESQGPEATAGGGES